MIRDGVTSCFELEVGTGVVEGWYREREGGQRANYGVSVGHIPTRIIVLNDPGDFLPSGAAKNEPASDEQIEAMRRRISDGLDQGAVAVPCLSTAHPQSARRPRAWKRIVRATMMPTMKRIGLLINDAHRRAGIRAAHRCQDPRHRHGTPPRHNLSGNPWATSR